MSLDYVNASPISTYCEFREAVNSLSSGIVLIKPRVLLERIETEFGIPVEMKFQVPSSKIGSILTLEATVMVALLRLINPSRVFEFGTFLGYSTALFLNNSDADIFSIDLPPSIVDISTAKSPDKEKLLTDDSYNDGFLSAWASRKGEIYLKGLLDHKSLNLIKCDSQDFAPESLNLVGGVDYIFVDGGHSYNIIESDTRKAFQMLNDCGILVWHDFNSRLHGQVTEYLRELSADRLIVHVESTMLAFSGPGLVKI